MVTVSCEWCVVWVTMGSKIVAGRSRRSSKRGFVFIGLLAIAAAFVVVTATGKTNLLHQRLFALCCEVMF